MKQAPSISFLIPVFNTEKFVIECLNSLLPQIYATDEVIILDDCSTDNSLMVIQDYIKHQAHKNIKVFSNYQNQGISLVRNGLICKASKDFIWFVDSDDIVVDSAVLKVKECLSNNKIDILCCNYFNWIENNALEEKKGLGKAFVRFNNKPYPLKWILMKSDDNYLWNKICRRELLQEVVLEIQHRKYFEDIEILTSIACLNPVFNYLNYPVIKYRQNPTSLVKHRTLESFFNYFEVYLNRYNIWSQNSNDTHLQGYFSLKILSRYISMTQEMIENEELQELRKILDNFDDRYRLIYNASQKKLNFIRALKLRIKWNKLHNKLDSLFG